MTPEHVFYVLVICGAVGALVGLLFWSVDRNENLTRPTRANYPVDRDETDEAGA